MSEEPTEPEPDTQDTPTYAIQIQVGYDGQATYESGLPAQQTIDVLQRLVYNLWAELAFKMAAEAAEKKPDRGIEDVAIDAELV